jgi:CBS domain-containing protein
MKARDLMTENPECVTENDTIEHAAQLMRELNVGCSPWWTTPAAGGCAG